MPILLCPKQLGLLELPPSWTETIRQAFNEPYGVEFNAPLRVSFQMLTPSSVVVQNYNKSAVKVSYNIEKIKAKVFKDQFSGKTFTPQNGIVEIELAPRSRVWLKTAE